ncbi:MAG: acyl carrier protein [Lachnospiraceae bacterium]
MSNLEKYNNAFINALSIAADQLNEDLCYQDITEWDSVGHMNLIAELEDSFDIMLETDDIIDFSSYVKGKEILAKYGITF